MKLRENRVNVSLRYKLAMYNKKYQNVMCQCVTQIFSAMLCQELFELVYSWESYHKNKKGKLFY